MEARDTLRTLLKGVTELRDEGLARAPGATPDSGWFALDDAFLDDPLPEMDVRYEREGNVLKVYRLAIGSLHWYVAGKYELR
jgi:hypothetical protein